MLADEIIDPLALPPEALYFLITGLTHSAIKRVKYPLEAVFILNPNKSTPKNSSVTHCVHKIPTHFIHNCVPENITNEILALTQNYEQEKGFFIDNHLPLAPSDRLELYYLFMQTGNRVYFLKHMIDSDDEENDFIEIVSAKNSAMLFDKTSKWEEGTKDESKSYCLLEDIS
ncbi:MAG: hypothetical protein LBS71_01995 [Puniceicoccales bacterium]|jgi:hypothetical protein|nr:hypothetical protein [Puniceicoccales bacterium]